MFAAVVLTSAASSSPVKTIIGRLYGTMAELEAVRTKTVRYYIIKTKPDRSGHVNWMQITGIAENAGIQSLLLPRGLEAPERCRSIICSSEEYRRIYVYRIARMIARESGIPASKLRVGLIDWEGRQEADFAGKALTFSGTVKVITKNAAGYAFLQKWDSSGDAKGPCVSAEPDISFLDDCQIIMAPFGVDGLRIPCTHRGVTVSALPVPPEYGGFTIDGFEPLLPHDIKTVCPPNTDILEYASALWKYGGLSPLNRLPVERLFSRGRVAELKEIAKIIDSFAAL